MTNKSEFEYLEEAFTANGWECEAEIDEDDNCARFCVCKGDVSAEFEAKAGKCWNPLSRRYSTVTVEIKGERSSHDFGRKRPGVELTDFCMTGFNRAGGDCPKDYSRKVSARRIVNSVLGAINPARPDRS